MKDFPITINQIRVLDDDTLRSAMELTFEEYSRRQAERTKKMYESAKKEKNSLARNFRPVPSSSFGLGR